jgi:ATP-dependent 26S proteasome regulatory subunit
MRTWQTLMDDLGGSDSNDHSSSSSSGAWARGSLFGRPFSSLEELEAHIEEQLRELAPPEIVTWLQDFEQQARQHQQQQQQQQGQQQQQDFRRSGIDGSESSMYGGGGSGALPPASEQAQAAQQQQQQQLQPWQQPAARSAVHQLQQLGAQVYLPSAAALVTTQQDGTTAAAAVDDDGESGWGSLAGYESQKQALEDYLLLPLKHPEVGSLAGHNNVVSKPVLLSSDTET